MTRIDEQLDQAIDDLMRATTGLHKAVRAARDAMEGQPGAQAYDTIGGSGVSSVLDDRGIPMPAVSDPTGEAAVRSAMGRDRASSEHRELQKRMNRLAVDSAWVLSFTARWQPRQPTNTERRAVEEANRVQPAGCSSCERLNHWNGVHRDDLCRWCYDWRRNVGGVPPVDKLSMHHKGYRVMVPVLKVGACES